MEYNPFDSLAEEYEAWFVENKTLFQSELLALKQVIPVDKTGVEIGIGSGVFAEQLGIRFGIDPSEKMLEYARKRTLKVQKGVAEELPYEAESFDYAAFITSICFVDNPLKAVREAYRVLKKEGGIIIAIIDKETPFGKFLESGKKKSRFYKDARFFSTDEIIKLLEKNSFKITNIFQTLKNLAATIVENPVEGYGEGSFVVIKGTKYID
ncbi:MAG: class I SAM-dependent methyltransferase [Bacteroidota bacterium]